MAKKSKQLSRAKIENMLYALSEEASCSAFDAVEGLEEWFNDERSKRFARKDAIKRRALSKLSAEERSVLGYGDPFDGYVVTEDSDDSDDSDDE